MHLCGLVFFFAFHVSHVFHCGIRFVLRTIVRQLISPFERSGIVVSISACSGKYGCGHGR